jgi:hypothetical protein
MQVKSTIIPVKRRSPTIGQKNHDDVEFSTKSVESVDRSGYNIRQPEMRPLGIQNLMIARSWELDVSIISRPWPRVSSN